MKFFVDVLSWFTTADHWWGATGILHRGGEHVGLATAAVVTSLLIGLPIGLALGHRRRGGTITVNLANIGRALPSFGILVLAAQAIGLRGWPGFGARPAFIALVALGVPPIVTNAFVGIREVDPAIVEAARGMGMTGGRVLWQVEVPLSIPVIMAGVRTSAVQVVATATLAAVVAWGGLGRYVVDGLAQRDNVQVFAGAVLVAVLAVATESVLGRVQRVVTPAGIRPKNERGT